MTDTTAGTVIKDARSYRLTNIDMLRGLVIIIMALDHVRDFFYAGGIQDPMAQPDISVGIYLTRWVTHFCAPVFIFLAGTSVGLMADRKSTAEIGAFVFKRGIWLLIVEFFIISNAYTFTPFGEPALGGLIPVTLQVIWALAISMIVLAGVQFLGARFCMITGALIMLGHNLLDNVIPRVGMTDPIGEVWHILFAQGAIVTETHFMVGAYPLLAWVGLMMFGYGTAYIFKKPAEERDKILLKSGLIMIAAFIVIRFLDVYGDPNPWQVQELGLLATIFDFMNVSKYPPSLSFLLATMGPMAIVCAYADKWQGKVKDILVMFGRVPFMFYVAHFYLIHALSVVAGVMQGFEAHQFIHFFIFYPEGYGISLLGVYGVWVLVCVMLYPLCKWFADLKSRRRDWWLSYL